MRLESPYGSIPPSPHGLNAELIQPINTHRREAYPKIIFYEDQPVVIRSVGVTEFTSCPLPDYRY